MDPTGYVYVELPSTHLGAGEVVLAAALQLLPADITLRLGLAGVAHEPARQQIEFVQALCRKLAAEVSREVIVTADARLVTSSVGERGRIAAVVAAAYPAEAMKAVMIISAVAQAIDTTRLNTCLRTRQS